MTKRQLGPVSTIRKDWGTQPEQRKMTMGVTPVIIGVLFLLSIVSNIAKGRIRGGNGYADRSASPVPFWLIIGLRCVVVLVVLFPKQSMSIVQFGIEDTSADTQGKVEEFKQRKSAESETSSEQE